MPKGISQLLFGEARGAADIEQFIHHIALPPEISHPSIQRQILPELFGPFLDVSRRTDKKASMDRIIRRRVVMDLTGLSAVTLWRLERAGKFPKRAQVSAHRVGWSLREVEEWIQDRLNDRSGDRSAT